MLFQKKFNNLGISKKITTIIAAAAIVTGTFAGLAGSYVAKNMLIETLDHTSEDLVKMDLSLLKQYMTNVSDDLKQVSSSELTAQILREFDSAWQSIENPKSYLQELFIKNNPHPAGQKDKLFEANDGSYYAEVHTAYHDVFTKMKDAKGYYDVFLINAQGDVIYSVYKEADYATNLINGEWKESDLGKLFREIKASSKSGEVKFKDFAPYEPSANLPASFMGSPILSKSGKFLGAVVYQMPVDRLNELFKTADEDHGTYVIGQDGTLRNDLVYTKENDILKTKSSIENINDLKGQFLFNLPGLIFEKAAFQIGSLNFSGVEWTIVSEHSEAVIDETFNSITLYSMLASLCTSIVVAILGFLYARSFARPVVALADTVDKLANGFDADIPCKDNLDEIGTLARSLTVINTKSKESSRIASALDGANAMMMIAEDNLDVVYANKKLVDSIHQSRDYFKNSGSNLNINKFEENKLVDFFGNKSDELEKILVDLHKPYQTDIEFDNRYFQAVITPVYDKSGNRIGFVAEWLDKTSAVLEERAAEARRRQEQEIESQVSEVIQAAASGNFKQRLHIDDERQSIRVISDGINQICETVDGFLYDLSETVGAFAEGDLTKSLEGIYQGQFSELKDSLNSSFSSLSNTVKEIATVGNAIKAASSDITTGSDDLSGRTEAQAASIEETVATMEEMSASVRNNANSAVQASNLAQETLTQAEEGGRVVSKAVEAMHQIETSAHRITEIVSVIDSIASQTNLLALNAAVEAARAGEAGKGFAVVASEVRTLASRCSEAARDIRGLITGSNAQVVDGVKLVSATGTALRQIVESVNNVASTITSISQASREQATGIEEISGAISQMDEITQQNAGLADNSAANARQLAKEADVLSELVRSFKTDTASSILKSVTSKMTTERASTQVGVASKKPARKELSVDNFSDFGTAVGDDWSDL